MNTPNPTSITDSSGSSSEESDDTGVAMNCKPRPKDVVLGRGKKYRTHPGNVLYTELVKGSSHRYLSTTPPLEKRSILEAIVDQILEQGRFLQRDERHSLWVPVSRDRAMTKTALAIQYRQRMTLNNRESASRTRPCISPYYEMVNRWSIEVGAEIPDVEEEETVEEIQQDKHSYSKQPALALKDEGYVQFTNYHLYNQYETYPRALPTEMQACYGSLWHNEQSAFFAAGRPRHHLSHDTLREWRNEHGLMESQPCVQLQAPILFPHTKPTPLKRLIDSFPTTATNEDSGLEGGWESEHSESSDMSAVSSVGSLDSDDVLDGSFLNFEW